MVLRVVSDICCDSVWCRRRRLKASLQALLPSQQFSLQLVQKTPGFHYIAILLLPLASAAKDLTNMKSVINSVDTISFF